MGRYRGLGWLPLWFLGSGRGREGVVTEQEGLRQLASVNTNTRMAKVGEMCRGLAVVRAIGSFVCSERSWGYLWSRSLQATLAPAMWLLSVAPAFLFVPSHCCTAQFCFVQWGETEAGLICGAMKV